MRSDLDAAMQFAHQANIDRYRKILAAHPTPEERSFVKQRIAEEQAALERLAAAGSQKDKAGDCAAAAFDSDQSRNRDPDG